MYHADGHVVSLYVALAVRHPAQDSGIPFTLLHETVLCGARELLAFRAHNLWLTCLPFALFQARARMPPRWCRKSAVSEDPGRELRGLVVG
jgi:hypothetical protein